MNKSKVFLVDHLDKLNAFKVTAESRTMGEAAKRLHLTQPSLTKIIQILEAAAEAQLLIRGRQGVSVTEAGRKMHLYCNQTLSALSDLEQKMAFPDQESAGHIRIGAFASLGEYLWPEFLPTFRKQYPQTRLSILSGEGVNQLRALEMGDIDILIDAEPRASSAMTSWNLYEDRFNFYVGKGADIKFTSDSIERTTLIYSPTAFDSENKKVIHHLEEGGYFFKERLEFDSFTAVLAFVRKGIGLAVIPERLAQKDLISGKVRRATLKGFPSSGFGNHHFAATVMDSKKDDPRIKALLRSLKEWLTQVY